MNSFQFSESPNRLSYWNLNDFGTGGTLTRIPLNCNYPCGDLAVPSNCPNPLPDPSGSDPGRASGGCAVRGVAGVGSVLPEGGGYVRERAAPAEKLRPGGEARRLCGEGRGLGIGSPGPLTHYRFPELQETWTTWKSLHRVNSSFSCRYIANATFKHDSADIRESNCPHGIFHRMFR